MLDPASGSAHSYGLQIEVIDLNSGIARLYGKGRKERYDRCPYTRLRRCSALARECHGEGLTFFVSEERLPLTASGLYQHCKRISIEAEVHLAPHNLRHTFAITDFRAGGNAFCVQKLLAHTTFHTAMT